LSHLSHFRGPAHSADVGFSEYGFDQHRQQRIWLMAVAGRGSAATFASPAHIGRPANSSAHRPCCGMGWLDNSSCGFGHLINRGINVPRSENPVSADAPAVAFSSAPSSTVEHSSVVVPPAKLKEVQLDYVPVPSSPTTKSPARGPEQRIAK